MKKVLFLVAVVMLMGTKTQAGIDLTKPLIMPIKKDILLNVECILGKLMRSGHFDRLDKSLKMHASSWKHLCRKGSLKTRITLLRTRRDVKTKELLADMKKYGYRPITLYELEALNAFDPDLKWRHSVVALGTRAIGSYGWLECPVYDTINGKVKRDHIPCGPFVKWHAYDPRIKGTPLDMVFPAVRK